MGSRLYDEFMKKLKVPLVQRREIKCFNEKDGKKKEQKLETKDEICICIQLKGGQGVSLSNNSNILIVSYGVR